MISLSFSDALAVRVTTASLVVVSGVVSIAKTALLRVVTLILGPAQRLPNYDFRPCLQARTSSERLLLRGREATRSKLCLRSAYARPRPPSRPGLLSGGRGSPRPAVLRRPAGST